MGGLGDVATMRAALFMLSVRSRVDLRCGERATAACGTVHNRDGMKMQESVEKIFSNAEQQE
jgi:hypothetical protein